MFKATVIGNLGRDPEVKFGDNGEGRATFSVAPRQRKKKGGEEKPAQWVNVVAFGKLGELCGLHLKKGQQVYLEGDIEVRQYTSKDGKPGVSTDMVARVVEFVGGPKPDAPAGDGTPF